MSRGDRKAIIVRDRPGRGYEITIEAFHAAGL